MEKFTLNFFGNSLDSINQEQSSIFNFIEQKRSLLGINKETLGFCSIVCQKINNQNYVKIRFQSDASYINLQEYSSFYLNYSSIPFKEVLRNNEVIFSSDVSSESNSVSSSTTSTSIEFDKIPTAEVALQVLIKRNTYTKNSSGKIVTSRRGNQFIRAIMYKISPELYKETKSITSKYQTLKKATIYPEIPSTHSLKCKFSRQCFDHLQTLKWDLSILNPAGDHCYCSNCFPTSWPNTERVGGETYIYPRGWMRFGFKTPKIFESLNNVWKTWPNVFYGTSCDSAFSIFLHKSLLIHGDITREGVRVGAISSSWEYKFYYVSQHICYASHPWYSKISSAGMRNGKKRYFQVVLAMKIRPGCYKKKAETEGGVKINFDDYSVVPKDEIEWYSTRRGCIMPYGALVRLFGKTKKKEIEDYD